MSPADGWLAVVLLGSAFVYEFIGCYVYLYICIYEEILGKKNIDKCVGAAIPLFYSEDGHITMYIG